MIFYKCVVGRYDRVAPAPTGIVDAEFICFSDDPHIDAPGWQVRPLPAGCPKNGLLANRYAKMHPHRLFPDSETSVYLDGNVTPKPSAVAYCQAVLNQSDFAVYRHPLRDRIADEAVVCARLGFDWTWRFQRQCRQYQRAGFKDHRGLFECNVLIRRHGRASVQTFCEAWWRALRSGVPRDQISFPYLLDTVGMEGFQSLGKSDPRHEQLYFALKAGHARDEALMTKVRRRINGLILDRASQPWTRLAN
jgi:hypothetical protein